MKFVPVRLVARKGNSAIIEYNDGDMPKRSVIAHNYIRDGYVETKDLENSAPYGVEFADMSLDLRKLPMRIQADCRRRGLWTKEDYQRNPTRLVAAIMSVVGLDAQTILKVIQEHD